MRMLLAIVVFVGGILALSSTADAARRFKRSPTYYYYAVPPRRADSVCEERARAEDPTGQFAGHPCWAREAFGRGRSGGRGR